MRTFMVELKQKENLGLFCKAETGFVEKRERNEFICSISPKTLREKRREKFEKEKKGRKKKKRRKEKKKKKKIGKKN